MAGNPETTLPERLRVLHFKLEGALTVTVGFNHTISAKHTYIMYIGINPVRVGASGTQISIGDELS